jgi:integrase
MASFIKRGKKWRAVVSNDGQRFTQTFDTKILAQQWAADLERKITTAPSTAHGRKTVGALLEKFLEEEVPKRAGKIWETRRIRFLLKTDLAALPLHADASDFAKWRDNWMAGDPNDKRRRVSGSTVNRTINLLSTAFTTAQKEWKWVPANPWADVKRPKNNPPRDRLVEDKELEMLRYFSGDRCDTVKGRVVYALRFCMETGLRDGEMIAMMKKNVNLDKSTIFVPAELEGERKSPKRHVALSAEAKKILKEVLDLDLDLSGNSKEVRGDVWGITKSQRDGNWQRLLRDAQIVDLHFHDSRHTACTRLAEHLSPFELARMMGWKNLNMVMRYYNKSAEDIAKRLPGYAANDEPQAA